MNNVMSMSPRLIHLRARGSTPNDKGEWTQTDWDKYCILREGERRRDRADGSQQEVRLWRKIGRKKYLKIERIWQIQRWRDRMEKTLKMVKVITGQMLPSGDTECWLSWISVKFTLCCYVDPDSFQYSGQLHWAPNTLLTHFRSMHH